MYCASGLPAKYVSDQLRSFKPVPSPFQTRLRTLLFPFTVPSPHQSFHLHSHKSSNSLSTQRLISSKYERFNRNGTWICSSLDASPRRTHINTSGNSTQGCLIGFKICRRALCLLLNPFSSWSCFIATFTSYRPATGYPTFTSMLSV
jgi:hypothetical protein